MDWAKSQTLWLSLFHYKEINPADVSSIVFGCGDPGDEIWGKFNFQGAVAFAERSKFDEDFSADADPAHGEFLGWNEDRHGEGAQPDYIPIRTPSRAHIDEVNRARAAARPPRAGTLAFPSGPFAGLSGQARNLMQRREQRRAAEMTSEDQISAAIGRRVTSIATPLIVKEKADADEEYEEIGN